ncbi:MAG: NAD(P)-binding domain-containing protein [Planctomycetota bacterium]|jgi:thioredoxin reductase (NADPH)
MRTHSTDVAIIGAGPIGLELAVALRQAGVDYVQLDAGAIGSTLVWWAPGTTFFSSPERIEIAGVPLVTVNQTKATREQYLAYLRGVVRQFGLEVMTCRRVTRAERDGTGFRLTAVRSLHGVGGPAEDTAPRPGRDAAPAVEIRCRSIVLATGNMHRARRLGVPGEDLPHVSHYFDEPHRYFGRRVVIVGGKNSAVEAALRCYRCGIDVTLSYRGDAFDPRRVKYWLRPEIEWLIDKGRIGWHPRTVPVEIGAETFRLASADGAGTTEELAADAVLLLTGYVQDPELFERLGLELRGDERAPVVDRATMQSSVPGVYVAGTAVGGTQERARFYIENSHVHVQRIVRTLTGGDVPWVADAEYAALEES